MYDWTDELVEIKGLNSFFGMLDGRLWRFPMDDNGSPDIDGRSKMDKKVLKKAQEELSKRMEICLVTDSFLEANACGQIIELIQELLDDGKLK